MDQTPSNVKRTRSPAYPAIALPQAVELLGVIFRSFQSHAAPVEAIGEAVGMKAGGSSLNVRLAALKKYGLIEESEGPKGAGKTYRISALGKDLVVLPQASAEHAEALRKAALMPVIYESLWTRFGPELPADSLIRSYLVRDRNFNAHQVDSMIADFRSTVEYAGLAKEATATSAPEAETIGQILQRYASPRPVSGAHVMPAAFAAPSEVFTIPLEEGKVASIPYPMSEQTWDLLMQTLSLWKPRLVAEQRSEG